MKWIKSLVVVILVILVAIAVKFDLFSNNSLSKSSTEDKTSTNETSSTKEIESPTIDEDASAESVIFPHDKVVDVNIEIDEDVYKEMNSNATNEEYVMANITYNGYTFNNIAIRPKGNSSLSSVVRMDSDRYSFKIDFNYYEDDQEFLGVTKINLNNIYKDPSMMSEYLGYEMLDDLDAVASRTNYVSLSINEEYFGLYLAVEEVNNLFLDNNYGNHSGEVYKPEQGIGSDLEYISDDGMDYTGMVPDDMDDYDNEDLVKLIKAINEGGDLESILNVDSYLKYLAVSTMTINYDSYQGGMFHNYYLYNNNGVFEWIAWDLNEIFNGFSKSGGSDEEAIQHFIDEPVSGAMSKYPLVEAIFQNEEYVEKYHEYLEILCEGYLSEDNINQKVQSTYDMIKGYVETDPTAFYSYQDFETALYEDQGTSLSLISFIQKRVDNVKQQLSGEIPSTNNGEGNAGSSSNPEGNIRGDKPVRK
jgi:spore coat protein CotH